MTTIHEKRDLGKSPHRAFFSLFLLLALPASESVVSDVSVRVSSPREKRPISSVLTRRVRCYGGARAPTV